MLDVACEDGLFTCVTIVKHFNYFPVPVGFEMTIALDLELICLTVVEALKVVSGLPYPFSTKSVWYDYKINNILERYMKDITHSH